VARKLLNLLGLLVDNIGNVGNMGINKLLVGLVDERCEEEDCSREKAEAPDWDNLDEEIGDEGTEEGLVKD
jgi:hypothetical protein